MVFQNTIAPFQHKFNRKPSTAPCGGKGNFYGLHRSIQGTHHVFFQRFLQREISFEYLTEEKFYPLSTSDEYLKSPCEQYPVTICGQTIILTNGELAAALLSLPEKKVSCFFTPILLISGFTVWKNTAAGLSRHA